MNRTGMLSQAAERGRVWDMIVVGGGATGLGVAVEAASRGYTTLLLEQADFSQGTSSRSTKLIHGGVRYLQQGNITLVLEALHERGLLFHNAPHLARHQSFIVPNYSWWEGPFYGIGMKFYDMLAGKLGIKPSKHLSRERTLELIPTLEPEDLKGGVMYYDGQFDDARLAITLALTAEDHGACLLNAMRVEGLIKNKGLVSGVRAVDAESGDILEIMGRSVVNATGMFVDELCLLDDASREPMIAPSQGVHIVLDKSFLPGDSAVMVPQTDDGRVLFAVPWHDRVIVGTTDTPIEKPVMEPGPKEEEIEFLLTHAARYLTKNPERRDVLSVFAGVRPLIGSTSAKKTAALSRDHHLEISNSGLVTIAGGKWTTYRKMGEDVVDHAMKVAGLPERPSRTAYLNLHGWSADEAGNAPYPLYGSDARLIKRIEKENPDLAGLLHEKLPYRKAEVVWATRNEMARTVEDVLARRTRSLILDARAAMAAAPEVAQLMADELGKDQAWVDAQVRAFTELATGYILEG
ncbi:glycerol-3-phosphate dehydrogenase/oxidase [Desulfoluna spongiiphila]|uniref:glycerol-3-phosphate dehydrogenase/oxidase n=1 Tax=Desulfoluna spongiiphila TaxID=419481 RepID=UPI0012558616|nr:glycerol-3-phosphate dehydrogenase/oxidase [Desulfoluna spongiiphila]VVS94102.1 fad dependent oxidoreductase [Desulfoluna spongiiphila]